MDNNELGADRALVASPSSPQAVSTKGFDHGERAWHGVHDKTDWARGEWDDEPDKIQWTDEASGLPCLIVRQRRGNLCGYVGVRPGHPWHGRHYDDCEAPDQEYGPDVHGGLTFAGGCQHSADPSRGVCHIPEPSEPDNVWWLGFDCAHAWDYSGMGDRPEWRERWGREADETYRDVPYVRRECRKLAAQAISAAIAQTPGQPSTATNNKDQSDG